MAAAGNYNLYLRAKFAVAEPAESAYSLFTLTVVNPCTANTITSSPVTIYQMIGDPAITVTIPLWPTTMPQCGSIVFSLMTPVPSVITNFNAATRVVTV